MKGIDSKKLIEGICNGDIVSLSKAVTLAESTLPEHRLLADEILVACLPYSGNSIRVGITGIPGAGKSTFIENFGLRQVEKGKKTAVLAIDPSSSISKGSILGDKTRMEKLSAHPLSFIRPSPAGKTLGGITAHTAEAIILCEAAGYEMIIVETVGVGQSEIAVDSVTDVFILLAISGAGDELQGIKRGIMELADLVLINKADGQNLTKAEMAAAQIKNSLHLFPARTSGEEVQVITCSALHGNNMDLAEKSIFDFVEMMKSKGLFLSERRKKELIRLRESLNEIVLANFYNNPEIAKKINESEKLIESGKISGYSAARSIITNQFGKDD